MLYVIGQQYLSHKSDNYLVTNSTTLLSPFVRFHQFVTNVLFSCFKQRVLNMVFSTCGRIWVTGAQK